MIRLFHIAFAALILAGSIGFDVFKHICSEDGTSLSLFVEARDSHCEEEKNSCCAEEQKDDDCCTDEQQIIQLKFDFFQKALQFAYGANLHYFDSVKPHFEEAVIHREKVLLANWNPPPPLLQSQRLAFIQVYRI